MIIAPEKIGHSNTFHVLTFNLD